VGGSCWWRRKGGEGRTWRGWVKRRINTRVRRAGAPSGLGGGVVMMPADGRGKSSYTYCTGMSTVTADVTLHFDWSMTGARGGTNSTYGMCHMLVLRDPN
jgi:hypothetical protein